MQTGPLREDGETADQGDAICLWKEHGRTIYSFFANRSGVTKEEAAELRQTTLLKAVDGLETFERRSTTKTWLLGIAKNVWLERCRSRKALKRQGYEVPVDEEPEPLFTDEPVALQRMLAEEEAQQLRAAIGRLPAEERRCIQLVDLRELSYADAAATLRLSENRVRSLLHRGRNRLKSWLAVRESSPPP